MLDISISSELAGEHPGFMAACATRGTRSTSSATPNRRGRADAGSSRRADRVASMASTAAGTSGMIGLADQLRLLRERVPLSTADVTAATGADEATVLSWLERREGPAGDEAARLSELIAVVEMLEESTRPDAIGPWLHRSVPALNGRAPVDVIASGGYEQVYELEAELAAGVFT